jgi:hypothetical protein
VRKYIFIFTIILIVASIILGCSVFAGESLNDLKQKKYFDVFEDQCFLVNLENWGKVEFISSEYHVNVCFYLIDKQKKIVYNFPKTMASYWRIEQITAISFKDVDRDGLKDVIILGDYSSGVGNDGMIPFKYCTIYFQKGKNFLNIDEVDDIINAKEANQKDIKTIVKVTTANLSKIQKILTAEQKKVRKK